MSGWFKLDKDMVDDPRLLEMAMSLSESYTLARHTGSGFLDLAGPERLQFFVSCSLGALVKLWRYADEHLQAGDELPMTSQTLDAFVGLEGFFDAVPRDWVNELDDGRIVLPGYSKKNSLITRDKRRVKQQGYTARWRVKRKVMSEHAHSISHDAHMKDGECSPTAHRGAIDQDQDLSSLTSAVPHTQNSIRQAQPAVEIAGPVERVFQYWQAEYARPRTVLDVKRRKIITAALKQFDEATLKAAIVGYKNSSHHMGQTDGTVYNNIELFLRDASHIEAGLQFGQRGAVLPLSPVEMARQKLQTIISNGSNGHAHVSDGCDESASGGDLEPSLGLFR